MARSAELSCVVFLYIILYVGGVCVPLPLPFTFTTAWGKKRRFFFKHCNNYNIK